MPALGSVLCAVWDVREELKARLPSVCPGASVPMLIESHRKELHDVGPESGGEGRGGEERGQERTGQDKTRQDKTLSWV